MDMGVTPEAYATILGITIAYFVIVAVVGVWTKKYVRSLKDWVIGDFPFAIIFGHMVATLYSGMALIGASGLNYRLGVSAFAELWPVACLLMVSAVFGPRIWKYARENNLMTIPDLFEHYFGGSKLMRVLAVILVFVTVVILLIAQWTAVGIGMSLILGVPYWISVLVGTVIVIAYTFSGGMWAVAVTDLIQFIVFAATVIVIAVVTIPAFGGLDGILNELGKIDPKLLEPLGRGAPFIWPYIVTHYAVLFLGISAHPRMVHRIYSNRKVEYFKWLPLAGVLSFGICFLLPKYVAMAARVAVAKGLMPTPPTSDWALPYFIYYLTNPLIAGLFLATLFAACMSTADTLLAMSAPLFTRDIYQKLINPNVDEKKLLPWTRVSAVVIGVIAMVVAFNPPAIIPWIVWTSEGLAGCTLGVSLLYMFYAKKLVTKAGVAASIISGLVLALSLGYYDKFISPLPMNPFFVPLIVSAIICPLVSALTRPKKQQVHSSA
jgi:SSS family solute:Na+ symporter